MPLGRCFPFDKKFFADDAPPECSVTWVRLHRSKVDKFVVLLPTLRAIRLRVTVFVKVFALFAHTVADIKFGAGIGKLFLRLDKFGLQIKQGFLKFDNLLHQRNVVVLLNRVVDFLGSFYDVGGHAAKVRLFTFTFKHSDTRSGRWV